MAFKPSVTNQQIIDAYKETGSVWRAAKMLGLCGQSVWERLRRLKYELPSAAWSKQEVAELRRLIKAGNKLSEVARILGRPYGGTANKASQLGIRSDRTREKKSRRQVLSKQQTDALAKELETYRGSFTGFSRQHGHKPDAVANAMQKYAHNFWAAYTKSHGVEQKTCGYCGELYYPMNSKQATCGRKCQRDLRVDRQYFGGNRRNTIGLKEGVCQLCGLKQKTGLSSHHILGAENDPNSEMLIALCQGCHKALELAISRPTSETAEFWENFIGLALGKKLAGNGLIGTRVHVDIDLFQTYEEFEAG